MNRVALTARSTLLALLVAAPSAGRGAPAPSCSDPPPDLLIRDAQPFPGDELDRQLARALLPSGGRTLYLVNLRGRGPEEGVYLTHARDSCQVVRVWVQGGSYRLAAAKGRQRPPVKNLRAPLSMQTCKQLAETWAAVLSTSPAAPAARSLPPCCVVMDGSTYHLGLRVAGDRKAAHAEPQCVRPRLDAFFALAGDLARFVYVGPQERASREAALRRSAAEVAAAFGEAPAPGR